jgi:hypothetical protein
MSKNLLVIIAAFVLFSCQEKKETKPEKFEMSQEELIKRGKYLTTVGACHDCHTPKVMTEHGPVIDTTRLLSGHPMNDPIPPIVKTSDWILFDGGLTTFVGPWGLSFSANLTPDETGIGNWTFEQFKTALRKGKSKGLENNRPLLPPMPWEMYKNYTDEDMKAVYTFLRSLPPIKNVVPAPVSPDKLNSLATNKTNQK